MVRGNVFRPFGTPFCVAVVLGAHGSHASGREYGVPSSIVACTTVAIQSIPIRHCQPSESDENGRQVKPWLSVVAALSARVVFFSFSLFHTHTHTHTAMY